MMDDDETAFQPDQAEVQQQWNNANEQWGNAPTAVSNPFNGGFEDVKTNPLHSGENTTVTPSFASSTEGKERKGKFPGGYITVHPPEIRGPRLRQYHSFKITLEPNVVPHVFRRYSDFVWLRNALVTMFPGLFVPPLPPKKFLSMSNEDFMKERRKDLERFLNRVVKIYHLAESDFFQEFITATSNWEDVVKDLDDVLKKRDNFDTLSMYNTHFQQATSFSSTGDSAADSKRIDALYEFMKMSETKLQGLADESGKMAAAAEDMYTSLGNMNVFLDQLYTTEKGYMECPKPPRIDVMDEMKSWHLHGTTLIPLLGHQYNIFKYELQDCQAFLELLSLRNKSKEKTASAQKTAQKWRDKSTGAMSEKDNKKLTAALAAEKEQTELLTAMDNLILNLQVPQFWAEKTSAYRVQLSTLAQEQLGYIQSTTDVWNKIGEKSAPSF